MDHDLDRNQLTTQLGLTRAAPELAQLSSCRVESSAQVEGKKLQARLCHAPLASCTARQPPSGHEAWPWRKARKIMKNPKPSHGTCRDFHGFVWIPMKQFELEFDGQSMSKSWGLQSRCASSLECSNESSSKRPGSAWSACSSLWSDGNLDSNSCAKGT